MRKGGSSEDRALLGPRVDVRQDGPKVKLGWSNISIHGKYKQIEIFFLTWNDFYIAGTINCFRIKKYFVMFNSLTASHMCDS